MKRKLAVIQIFILLMAFGCGGQFQKMSAVDQASSVAKEISLTYIDLYNLAKDITENGSLSQKTYMKENINPKLNEAKKMIVTMNRAVAYWKKNGTDGMSAIEKQEALNKLLEEVSKMILEIM